MARLNLVFLGGFQVWLEGSELAVFDSNKMRALLAYLAAEPGRARSREFLADLLWPELPRKAALDSLRNALAGLRRAIGDPQADPPFLQITREAIGFNRASAARADLWEFQAALNFYPSPTGEQDWTLLEGAVGLYGGPFLQGFSIADSAPFEEWLVLTRERLGQDILSALARLSRYYEERGEWQQALTYAQRQTSLEPWLEEAHRQVMRILACSGQRSAALAQYQACRRLLAEELGVEPAQETTRLYEAIRAGSLADLRISSLLPAPGKPPFKGLEYFNEADAPLYFGREILVEQLADEIGAAQETPDGGRAFTVVGASGSGKSSLVRAGLAPALRQRGWQVRVITPTAHPLEQVHALEKHIPGDRGTILIVDQLEELFSACRSETERADFTAWILEHSPAVVLVLRADFYGHCARYARLRQALSTRQVYLGPMQVEELRRAIQRPAERAGWSFEDGLVDLILRDVGAAPGQDPEPGALPLLEHALLETWQRREGRSLTLRGYIAAGGVRGAIAQTAESVFGGLLPPDQALVRRIFLRLTQLGENTQDTRRRAPLAELYALAGADASEGESCRVEDLLYELAAARLITLSENSAEVAHEALIREWPALQGWLAENREGLRLHRRLTESAAAWDALGRNEDDLYTGARLAQALEWAARQGSLAGLTALESAFLTASQRKVERQAEEREAQHRRELQAAQALAESEQRRADEQAQAARLAYAGELAATARARLRPEPDLSSLLALQAVDLLKEAGLPVPWDVQQAVHDVALGSRLVWKQESTHQPWGVVWREKSGEILYNDDDGTIHRLDAISGTWLSCFETIRSRPGRPSAAKNNNYIEISPDERWFASPDIDAVFLWDAASGELALTITLPGSDPWFGRSPAFNPDASTLAVTNLKSCIYLYDLRPWYAAGCPRDWVLSCPFRSIPHPQALAPRLTFSPDGRYLAVNVLEDHATLVFEVATGSLVQTFRGHSQYVVSTSFSPDGSRLLTSSFDQSARVWDLVEGKELFRLTGHIGWVNKAVYSPGGAMIVTGGADGRVIWWDAASGQQLFDVYTGSLVLGLALNQSGDRLVSVSEGGMVCLWSSERHTQGEIKVVPARPHWYKTIDSPSRSLLLEFRRDGSLALLDLNNLCENAVHKVFEPLPDYKDAAFSPDGSLLAVECGGALSLIEVRSGERMWDCPPDPAWDAHIAFTPVFSPDGSWLVCDANSEYIVVRAVDRGEVVARLPTGLGGLNRASFSSNGKWLALGGSLQWFGGGGKVLLWNTHLQPQEWGQPRVLEADMRGSYELDFSPDDLRLVTSGCESLARIWDVETGQETMLLLGHTSRLFSVRYSPDGRYLVTTSWDKTVRVWDAANGADLLTYTPLELGGMRLACFTPDSRRVVAVSDEGVYSLLSFLDFDELVKIVRARSPRSWRPEERSKYLGKT